MKIEFVSYTGKYPNLCSGVAKFKIDGKVVFFGHEQHSYDWNLHKYRDCNFPDFWVTGGSAGFNAAWDEIVTEGPWKLSKDWKAADENHPAELVKIMPKLLKLFNENVPFGCCGGCI